MIKKDEITINGWIRCLTLNEKHIPVYIIKLICNYHLTRMGSFNGQTYKRTFKINAL